MENATISKIETLKAPLYISTNYAGFNFQIIYGEYISGSYCCIPNWGVSADLSEYSWATFYNAERLENAFIQMENWESDFAFDVGINLALAIKEAVEYAERKKDE
ncbi:MAG: DUF6618 family protein [Beduini sp.]|uniref:DUF6618 family protein n=1 Tax=Beduini sp. TaxID=1922300 RepID=UPI003990A1D7